MKMGDETLFGNLPEIWIYAFGKLGSGPKTIPTTTFPSNWLNLLGLRAEAADNKSIYIRQFIWLSDVWRGYNLLAYQTFPALI